LFVGGEGSEGDFDFAEEKEKPKENFKIAESATTA
jgi:hypothetical protein